MTTDPQTTIPEGAAAEPEAPMAKAADRPLAIQDASKGKSSLKRFEPVRKVLTDEDFAEIQMALPPEMRARAADYVHMVLVDIPRNKYLAEVATENPRSVVACLLDAARMGLRIGIGGEAYLVPYKDTVTLITGYRGLLALARRSGQIASLDAQCVYEGDEVDIQLGSTPMVTHRPLLSAARNRETCTGAYMVCRLVSGEVVIEWMSRADIEAVRQRSRAGQSGPWVTDWTEMARKTVLRRGLKRVPVVDEYHEAIRREDDAIEVTAQATTASPIGRALTYGGR